MEEKMADPNLFSDYQLGKISVKNRMVMAPLTRCRAPGNIPNDLMALYYSQRAEAGLIITEGTSPSPNGLGYPHIPGIFNEDQVQGWKKVTAAVHGKNGKIFVQLMHTGRISLKANLPATAQILAPSAVLPAGYLHTATGERQDFVIPKAMTAEELVQTRNEYVQAAKNAIKAGFDGVELHAANGYLLEQFLSPFSNIRTDNYGGSIINRCRFVLETAQAVTEAIGKEKTGIRISPYGVASDMKPYPEIDETYTYLAGELEKIGIVYIHVVDHSSMGAPVVPDQIKQKIKEKFHNTLILSGGYDQARAEKDITNKACELVAFGRPFITNPDLVNRFVKQWPVNQDLDQATLYSPGEKGYTDYPVYNL